MKKNQREGIIFECEIMDTGEKMIFRTKIMDYCEFCIGELKGIECWELIFECKIILNLLREESKERNQEIIFLKYYELFWIQTLKYREILKITVMIWKYRLIDFEKQCKKWK